MRRRRHHLAAPRRNGGRNYVSDQGQRKSKRCNTGKRAQRKTPNDPPSSCREFLPVERQVLAINPRALFRSDGEGKDRAFNFGTRGLDRLACFLRQSAGKFLLAFRNGLCHAAEHPLALECRKPARGSERCYRVLDRRCGVRAASLTTSRYPPAVVPRLDLR